MHLASRAGYQFARRCLRMLQVSRSCGGKSFGVGISE